MLDERATAFLAKNRAAAMTSLRRDGTVHVARVAVGLVDGKLWSSSTRQRLRTGFLQRDPSSTLFVFEGGGPRWLGLETTVTILDGPEVPDLTIRLFRMLQKDLPNPPPEGKLVWGGQVREEADFKQVLRDEQRILYEFDVKRAYGMY